ncbi:MAG TPA: chromate efflux transporter [Anaerolineales bacterium]|nr:chromate efflux transporter [Anaerolineales bacterium]
MAERTDPVVSTTPVISFPTALKVWVRVAVFSFGGPAGQIAVMHRILVEEKRWVSENRFLHALNYTMLLPGPEAQQLATYIGWLLHGTRGGLAAGILFVIPGFLTILALSILYAGYQQLTFVQGLFFGLKPAVMAVVMEAVFRIGARVLKNRVMVAIAAAAFTAIFFFDVPFPLIVLAAGLLGFLGGRLREDLFHVIKGHEVEGDASVITNQAAAHARPSTRRALVVLVTGLTLWFGPQLALLGWVGPDSVFPRIGAFFSQAAVVTFGGAYAVLAYVAAEAVETFGWLQPGEMLDGLGMAETTPGPLIQVVQFVGFMGAYRNPGGLSPMAAGILGSILTTWVTFVPCFIWIFLGAPYIEHLRGNRSLSAALSSITAAVVGVVLNLGVWFSLNVLFATVDERSWGPVRLYIPDLATLDWVSLLIAGGAFLALFRFKVSMLWTLAGAAAVGLAYFLLAQ